MQHNYQFVYFQNLRKHQWQIQACCALTGEGWVLDEACLSWFWKFYLSGCTRDWSGLPARSKDDHQMTTKVTVTVSIHLWYTLEGHSNSFWHKSWTCEQWNWWWSSFLIFALCNFERERTWCPQKLIPIACDQIQFKYVVEQIDQYCPNKLLLWIFMNVIDRIDVLKLLLRNMCWTSRKLIGVTRFGEDEQEMSRTDPFPASAVAAFLILAL